MTWFKVDDRFHSHPKVLALRAGQHEETAITLWVKAGSWAASNLTNGEVPTYVLETLVKRNGEKAAAELVRVGLWETTAEGFKFRSWDEYQPTKEAVESRRRKNTEKVATWRERNRVGDQACNQVTADVATTPVTLPPSRPVPLSSLRSDSVGPDTRLLVRQHFGRWYEQAKATLWPTNQAKADDVRAVAEWVDQMAEREAIAPEAVIERVMRHFAADDFAQKAGSPWAHFAKNYANYWQKVAPKPAANSSNAAIGRGRMVY
jgi:hypothetical protein